MSTVRSGIASVSLACCLVLAGVARGAQPGIAGTDTFVRVFTIGGTVSGLTGSGLVLSDLGMVAQISANGEFTFPTFMPKGAKYDVSVTHQPGSPAQVCTVTNGSGVVTTTNITNIAVACEQQKHWHAAQEIGQSIGDSRDAKVATGPSGNALAVWTLQPDPSAPIGVFSNVFTPAGWGSPVQVSPVNPLDSAFRPKLQGDGAGNAFSVWHSFNGTLLNVQWSRYTANVGWSAPALIGNPAASSQVEPQIAVDSRGAPLPCGSSSKAIASGSWRAVLFPVSAGELRRQPMSLRRILTRAMRSSADRNRHSRQRADRMAAIRPGGESDKSLGKSLQRRRRCVGRRGGAGAGAERRRPRPYSANSVRRPRQRVGRLEPAPGGSLGGSLCFGKRMADPCAHWKRSQHGSTGCGLRCERQCAGRVGSARRLGAGGHLVQPVHDDAGWGTAAPIESHTGGAAGRVKIAVDTSGNALAVWQQRIDVLNTLNVWALRFSSSTGWGSPEEISNGASTAAGAEIVVDTQGNAFAVWEQGDSSDAIGVWSNRFDDRQ